MKFSTRLTLSAVVPAVLFGAAVSASLLGLFRTENEFANLLMRDQRLVSATSEMYAQGLQMGQALRNIVLDPSKQAAYDNFKNAAEGYDKAYESAKGASSGTTQEADIAALAKLRAAQHEAQTGVMMLAKTDQAAAIQFLNTKETPAWRTLRGKLLEEGKQARRPLLRPMRQPSPRRPAARPSPSD